MNTTLYQASATHAMQLLKPDEAAKLLRVSPYWLKYQRLKKIPNSVPYVRIGSRVFYDRQELLDWLKKQRVNKTDQPADKK